MGMYFKCQWSLVLSFLYILNGCNKDDDNSFDPIFTTEANKITAEFCYDFGRIITADQNYLAVSSYEDIHIFKYDGSGIELIQEIDFDGTSGILSMVMDQSDLYFGLADAYGTGTVYIYTRNGESWDLKQELSIGRNEDNFGSDIDIDGNKMVIGASAPWADGFTFENKEEGRAYIFEYENGIWVQKNEFLADQSEPDDRFGTCVALYNDIMLIGSPMQPLHIYRFNGEWELLRTEDISAFAIEHCEDNFLIGGEYHLNSFLINSDGSFSDIEVNQGNEVTDISWHGEIIEIKDSLAIVDVESSMCYLFKFSNGQWIKDKDLTSDPGEFCTFHGMAITDQHAIIGGMNIENSQYSYVYFRDL